jgi:flagella basal body P-ring formation protein FlgA
LLLAIICATIGMCLFMSLFAGVAIAQEAQGNAIAKPEQSDSRAGIAHIRAAIATRALRRGESLQDGDFRFIDTTIVWRWSVPPVDTNPVRAGWVAQRAISAGEVLRIPSVRPQSIITAGEMVTALWQDGSVQIAVTGVAVSNAALGAPVGVRVAKNRRLDGIAVAPDTVRIRMTRNN